MGPCVDWKGPGLGTPLDLSLALVDDRKAPVVCGQPEAEVLCPTLGEYLFSVHLSELVLAYAIKGPGTNCLQGES